MGFVVARCCGLLSVVACWRSLLNAVVCYQVMMCLVVFCGLLVGWWCWLFVCCCVLFVGCCLLFAGRRCCVSVGVGLYVECLMIVVYGLWFVV